MAPALPRTGHRVVVKVGGSHAADRARIGLLVREMQSSPVRSVIVPGGGAFADAVRDAQGMLGFSDRLAHRFAMEAMITFARVLTELFPPLVIAENRQEIDAAHAAGRLPVFSVARLLTGHPDVPESWAMTSDSFAALIAWELDAAGLILVKSTDGPEIAAPADLTAAGITDDAFPSFADRLSCPIRLIGPDTLPRLADLLADPRRHLGTIVRGA